MDLFEELQPKENATLWRFMDLFKFIDLITSNELTLVNLTAMQDPFEGVMLKEISIERVDLDGNPIKTSESEDSQLREVINKSVRKSLFISCWHENSCESAGMWDIYGNQKGIAIKTSVSKLKIAIGFDKIKEIDLLKINYYSGITDYFTPNIVENHIYTSMINKRKSFEHEREVRLIWHPRDYSNSSPIRKIDIDLESLIDTIYVSPFFDDWQLKSIEKLLKIMNINVAVQKSQLYELQ